MRMATSLSAGIFWLVFATASAQAAEDRKSDTARAIAPQKAFEALDTNRDGWIARPEVAAHPEIAARFKDADRDNDRRLSRAEYEAMSGAGAAAAGGDAPK